MRTERADVVIVGGGLLGLSTAWALRGRREVLVLERETVGNARGGSHGPTRIFRLGYLDPGYVAMAMQARDRWTELEAESGTRLLHPTPQLTFGLGADAVFAALESAGAPVEHITAAAIQAVSRLRGPGRRRARNDLGRDRRRSHTVGVAGPCRRDIARGRVRRTSRRGTSRPRTRSSRREPWWCARDRGRAARPRCRDDDDDARTCRLRANPAPGCRSSSTSPSPRSTACRRPARISTSSRYTTAVPRSTRKRVRRGSRCGRRIASSSRALAARWGARRGRRVPLRQHRRRELHRGTDRRDRRRRGYVGPRLQVRSAPRRAARPTRARRRADARSAASGPTP